MSERAESPIRVLLVDDHKIIRDGLRALITRQSHLEVAGEADDGKKAVEMAKGKALIEASGNVSLQSVYDVALTGVDIISVGSITHSVKSLDISLKIK